MRFKTGDRVVDNCGKVGTVRGVASRHPETTVYIVAVDSPVLCEWGAQECIVIPEGCLTLQEET